MRVFAATFALFLLTVPYLAMAELEGPHSGDAAAPRRLLLAQLATVVTVPESAAASRALLQGRGGTGAGSGVGSGGANGGEGRAFSSVAQHKQPRQPRLARKNFDRQTPF